MNPRSAWFGAAIAMLAVLTAGSLATFDDSGARAQEVHSRLRLADGYVDEAACAGCHQREATAWQRSHHAHAMEFPGPDSVRGNFEDATFESGGAHYRFFQREGDYFVETEGPDGAPAEFRIAYTFGWTPLQQYLVELDRGRLQALTVAWDTEAGKWFDLADDNPAAPGDPLHWTGREYNWNFRCADCHSTDLRKNFDPKTDSYHTTYAVVTVGCQACHGPAEGHLAWLDDGKPEAVPDMGFTATPTATDENEVCAQCHSRRRQIRAHNVFGEPFLDHYLPELLEAGLYFPDGQIDDEVYVYGSFLQSRMHQKGVTCSDCHDPHSGELWAQGNDVCTACHSETPPERFPTIKPLAYDSPAHHFHETGEAGSFCVDCHMPDRTYMTVDPRRDHSFRVPRPDLSEKTGSPDACTGCHEDRDAAWAAETIAERYGEDRRREPRYGEAIALGRRGAPGAGEALVGLAADHDQPAIARATAVELLQAFLDQRTFEAVASAAQDDEPMVRLAAMQALGGVPSDQRVDIAGPLLDDPVRAVRIAAARALAPVPPETFLGDLREPYQRAVDEYLASELAAAERPESHLNLGIYWTEQGDADAAEAAYRQALQLDPTFTPAMVNLAELYRATGREDEEAELLERAVAANPDDASAMHALGLLRVRQKRYDEAIDLLEQASEAAPGNARFAHVYAIALESTGRQDEARDIRADALVRNPYNLDLLFATLEQLLRDRDAHRARQIVDRLLTLRPDDEELQTLKDRLPQ